jgi:hypothetical protein
MRVLTLEEMELVAGGCGRSKGKKSKAKGKKGGKGLTEPQIFSSFGDKGFWRVSGVAVGRSDFVKNLQK